jgi:uncharacterized membrane protein YecN with MAPEG domain
MDNPFLGPLQMVAFYAAINALIMLVLGMLVVRARVKTQTEIGDGGNPSMAGPLRAHANNTETVPIVIVLLLVMLLFQVNIVVIHLVGGFLTLGRLLHGFGLSRNTGASTPRLLGMIFTWLSTLIAIAVVLWFAFSTPSA